MNDQSLVYRWQHPPVFQDAALRLIDIDAGDLFGDPKNQFRMEAYIAGEFAIIYNKHESCQVRLTEDGLYDFELQTGEGVVGFQAVEADQESRRRGDEYRNKPESSKAIDVDLDKEYDDARNAIQRVLGQKAARHYSPRVNIVVYVNLFFDDGEGQCARLTEPWKDDFESVWLLRTPNRLIRAWPSILILGW